jgi:hypothetical protein
LSRKSSPADEARYAFAYYGRLMTQDEQLAYRHLVGTAKACRGRTDANAQEEAKRSVFFLRELLSDDPKVLAMACDGIETFVLRTGQRILKDHSAQM